MRCRSEFVTEAASPGLGFFPDSSNEFDSINVTHNAALAMTFARPVAFGGYSRDKFSCRAGNPQHMSLGNQQWHNSENVQKDAEFQELNTQHYNGHGLPGCISTLVQWCSSFLFNSDDMHYLYQKGK
jgi:hypothetical protein